MSLPKLNSCGSCAAAITRTPSTDLVGRRVRAGIGARGTARQHDDLVTGRGQRGRQVMHVATQPADHDRRVLPRHHEDPHVHPFCRRDCAHDAELRPNHALAAGSTPPPQTRVLASAAIRWFVIAAAFARPGRRTVRRRGSTRQPAVARCRAGPTPARRRSRGWRVHAGGHGSGRSRRPSPCSP